MRVYLRSLLVGLAALLSGSAAQAQGFDPFYSASPIAISEVRLGIMAHDVYNGWLPFESERHQGLDRIEDFSVEVLFSSPYLPIDWIGLRPSVGGTFSTTGHESFVRAGLTFTFDVPLTPLFLEGTLGGALHNGALSGAEAPARNMGCQWGFYSNASIGMHLPLGFTGMVTYEHVSNSDLCEPNEGLSNLGLRIGKRF